MFFESKKELRDRIERLSRKIDDQIEEIARLRKEIKERENGGRIRGPHCSHCKHYGGDRLDYRNNVVVISERCCLKSVPCRDFERVGTETTPKEAEP